MNAIIFFALMTVINVTLSTIRSLCTIKGGKWLSATTNAICYGFYPLIVMLTAKGTVTILVNMIITAVANFVCVWLIKLVEEKARKERMNLTRAYDRNQYANMVNGYNNSDSNIVDAFSRDFTIDDMEITLPSQMSTQYEEKRKRFLEAISSKD